MESLYKLDFTTYNLKHIYSVFVIRAAVAVVPATEQGIVPERARGQILARDREMESLYKLDFTTYNLKHIYSVFVPAAIAATEQGIVPERARGQVSARDREMDSLYKLDFTPSYTKHIYSVFVPAAIVPTTEQGIVPERARGQVIARDRELESFYTPDFTPSYTKHIYSVFVIRAAAAVVPATEQGIVPECARGQVIARDREMESLYKLDFTPSYTKHIYSVFVRVIVPATEQSIVPECARGQVSARDRELSTVSIPLVFMREAPYNVIYQNEISGEELWC